MTNKKNTSTCVKIIGVIAFITLTVVFIVNSVLLYYISIDASIMALSVSRTVSIITCVISSLLMCLFFPKTEKITYYLKKIYTTTILLILVSIAISCIGGLLVNFLVGGVRSNISNPFLRGAILKMPLLIMYLLYIYNSFMKFGFADAQKMTFNLPLKVISTLYASLFMLSDTIYDSMYNNYSAEREFVNLTSSNLHTAFTPNIDLYADSYTVSNNFSMIAVIIGIVFVIAIELTVAAYSYSRGKKIFVKECLKSRDYESYAENSLAKS